MKRDKLNQFALLTIAMGALATDHTIIETPKKTNNTKYIHKEPKPPRGTKEYFFNKCGEFSTEQMLKTETVFKCYAINHKNAIRKFERWQRSVTTKPRRKRI